MENLLNAHSLPLIFLGLMGLSVLIYAILDGYDLGTGILLPMQNSESAQQHRDRMIASIGPFWDANETWLVLTVGLLLIAFPQAHSLVLKELYLPATFMLFGLIVRGVAFEFRAKMHVQHQYAWDWAFKIGSLVTSLCQGYMLGRYILGFDDSTGALIFAFLSSLGVTAAYTYIGGAWLVLKTDKALQRMAAQWTRWAGLITVLGIVAVCIVNLWVSDRIFEKWLSEPAGILLLPLPIVCFAFFFVADRYLKGAPYPRDLGNWVPFTAAILIFFISFQGLAYSFYPYVVPNQLTVWQAASAEESLRVILYGAVIVIPTIIAYTIFSYWVFRGKAHDLKYT